VRVERDPGEFASANMCDMTAIGFVQPRVDLVVYIARGMHLGATWTDLSTKISRLTQTVMRSDGD
jgi:hypothetical protein